MNKRNNEKKEIELLPEELRPKEEKKKEERKPKITFYIPPNEEKPKIAKVSFFEKIFGTKEEREKKKLARQKEKEERKKREAEEKAKLEALKKAEEEAKRKAAEMEKRKIEEKPLEKQKPISEVREAPKKIKMWRPAQINKGAPKIGITLIPEAVTPVVLPVKKQISIVLVFVLFTCFIVAVSYFVMFSYQLNIEKQTKAVLQNIEALKKEIALYEDDKSKAEKFQKQMEAANTLLVSHLYWTKFFDLLEKNTIPDVYYSNFVATAEGKVALTAVGKNFSAVAKQLVALREAKDFVKEVNITGASAQITPTGEVAAVNFEIGLEVFPEVFLK